MRRSDEVFEVEMCVIKTVDELRSVADACRTDWMNSVSLKRPLSAKQIPDDLKLQIVIDHLTRSHLGHSGGYPYDYAWVGDQLIVAGLHDPDSGGCETSIERYERRNMIRWFNRALNACLEDQEDDEEWDLSMALYETA
jgi:hypothetical protein